MAQYRSLLYFILNALILGLLSMRLTSAVPARATPAYRPSSTPSPPALQSWVQSKLIQGFVAATSALRNFPPLTGALVDRLQRRRRARGDASGAARLEVLRSWTSYVGLYRGIPVLAMDFVRHGGLAMEIVGEWAALWNQLITAPGNRGLGWPDLLVRERAAVLDLARRSLGKARMAFRGGAVARLLSDLYDEMSTDRHLVADLLAEAQDLGLLGHFGSGGGGGDGGRGAKDYGGGGGNAAGGCSSSGGSSWVSDQLAAMLQQVMDAAREALFPLSPSGSSTAGSQQERQRRRRSSRSGGGAEL